MQFPAAYRAPLQHEERSDHPGEVETSVQLCARPFKSLQMGRLGEMEKILLVNFHATGQIKAVV